MFRRVSDVQENYRCKSEAKFNTNKETETSKVTKAKGKYYLYVHCTVRGLMLGGCEIFDGVSVDLGGNLSYLAITIFLCAFLQAYERRARVVRPGKEATYWADVTADMMSDEERVGDKYIQHTPSYRSDKLNSFIKTLDKRAGKKGKSHARFHREQGSPRKQPIPQNAKPWMVKKHQEARDDLDVHSGEELDDDENSDMDGELFTSGEESGSSVVY